MKALSRLRRGASDALLSSSQHASSASTGSLDGLKGRTRAASRPGSDGETFPGGSPPSGGKPPRSRPPRRLQLLTLALLPALVATATLASLGRRHEAHSEVANALLAANARAHRWGSGHSNRLLWEAAASGGDNREAAASGADGRTCAEALQVPQARRGGQAGVAVTAHQHANRPGHPCLPGVQHPTPTLPSAPPPAAVQVAMLFLVKGRLRHEALWRAWFERAAGLLPTRAVASALCTGSDNLPSVLAACAAAVAGPPIQDPAAAAAAAVAAAAEAGGQRNASAAAAATAAGAAAAAAAAQQQTKRRDLSGSANWAHWLSDHLGAPAKERGPPPPSVLDGQHLFDIYVHPHPNFTGTAPRHRGFVGAGFGQHPSCLFLVGVRYRRHCMLPPAKTRMADGQRACVDGCALLPPPRHCCRYRLSTRRPAARPGAGRLGAGGHRLGHAHAGGGR